MTAICAVCVRLACFDAWQIFSVDFDATDEGANVGGRPEGEHSGGTGGLRGILLPLEAASSLDSSPVLSSTR